MGDDDGELKTLKAAHVGKAYNCAVMQDFHNQQPPMEEHVGFVREQKPHHMERPHPPVNRDKDVPERAGDDNIAGQQHMKEQEQRKSTKAQLGLCIHCVMPGIVLLALAIFIAVIAFSVNLYIQNEILKSNQERNLKTIEENKEIITDCKKMYQDFQDLKKNYSVKEVEFKFALQKTDDHEDQQKNIEKLIEVVVKSNEELKNTLNKQYETLEKTMKNKTLNEI